jgi:hypothetical protein
MLDYRDIYPTAPILFEAHDSFTAQVREDEVEEKGRKIKELLERPIDFSRCTVKRGNLVIPAEVMVGTNGKDFKPVKL